MTLRHRLRSPEPSSILHFNRTVPSSMLTVIPSTERFTCTTTGQLTRPLPRSQCSAPPAESKFGGTAAVLTNTLNNNSQRTLRTDRKAEAGVTILEMVVAMLVLTVGLLGLAASIGYAVTVS